MHCINSFTPTSFGGSFQSVESKLVKSLHKNGLLVRLQNTVLSTFAVNGLFHRASAHKERLILSISLFVTTSNSKELCDQSLYVHHPYPIADNDYIFKPLDACQNIGMVCNVSSECSLPIDRSEKERVFVNHGICHRYHRSGNIVTFSVLIFVVSNRTIAFLEQQSSLRLIPLQAQYKLTFQMGHK